MVSLVTAQVTHTRNVPIKHRFSYPMHLLLKNPAVPENFWERRLTKIVAKDHFAPGETATDLFAARGYQPARILVLTQGRSLGYVFNPLTVWFGLGSTGELMAAILEVHNTYQGRHSYLITPTAEGSNVTKEFYVSPFNEVSGEYQVQLVLTDTFVAVEIALLQNKVAVFSAKLTGVVQPASLTTALRHQLRFGSWWVAARIRFQGIKLWKRGLPVVPRIETGAPK